MPVTHVSGLDILRVVPAEGLENGPKIEITTATLERDIDEGGGRPSGANPPPLVYCAPRPIVGCTRVIGGGFHRPVSASGFGL
jgi:hypothetical protein